uniref:C3H1-type domain-containing protein n=1 Tax=Ditylum brightwellii TaxID=49249 RepID=A0A6U3UZE8_9STRA|mmetsp:Transcript_6849/g.10387  ORF Transcript_6849/g.10387 Transcript_6849/m.10387 type:complete len:289 (+) Transcript_6849:51-917(+)
MPPKKKPCPHGSNCKYQHEHQHTAEYSHGVESNELYQKVEKRKADAWKKTSGHTLGGAGGGAARSSHVGRKSTTTSTIRNSNNSNVKQHQRLALSAAGEAASLRLIQSRSKDCANDTNVAAAASIRSRTSVQHVPLLVRSPQQQQQQQQRKRKRRYNSSSSTTTASLPTRQLPKQQQQQQGDKSTSNENTHNGVIQIMDDFSPQQQQQRPKRIVSSFQKVKVKQWACTTCTFLNEPTNVTNCSVCGSARTFETRLDDSKSTERRQEGALSFWKGKVEVIDLVEDDLKS